MAAPPGTTPKAQPRAASGKSSPTCSARMKALTLKEYLQDFNARVLRRRTDRSPSRPPGWGFFYCGSRGMIPHH